MTERTPNPDGTGWTPPEGVVLIPTAQRWQPGDGDPRVQLAQTPDGTRVALAYTSPAALTAVHGEQPWVAVPRDALLRALAPLGVRHCLIDGQPVTTDEAGAADA